MEIKDRYTLKDKLKAMGPGILVVGSFIGPGTVTSATKAGAGYGYALLWTVVFSVIAVIVMQEMAARLGIVTQNGLAEELVKDLSDRPPLKWLMVALVAAAITLGGFAYMGGDLTGTAIGLSAITGIPSNIIAPFANASMLQVIVAALLFGFGILAAGEKGRPAAALVDSLTEVCMKVMDIILRLSPIGVFCLILPVVAENGPQILGNLGLVLLCAYIGYFLHAVIVYSATVKALGGVSPLAFFKGMFPAMAMAFSSASSVGTLPLNLECTERLGARRDIASFVLPLGATINMDGTAIYQGVCAVFIATCYGVDLTLGQMITIVLTATLASIGTAGVPGSGVVMLTMVLESVNLPVAGIGLVIGVDRIFDMGRTTVNITGDAACALVVSNLEKKAEARRAARRPRA